MMEISLPKGKLESEREEHYAIEKEMRHVGEREKWSVRC